MILISEREEFNEATIKLLYDTIDFELFCELSKIGTSDLLKSGGDIELSYIKNRVISKIAHDLMINEEEITAITQYLIDMMLSLVERGAYTQKVFPHINFLK